MSLQTIYGPVPYPPALREQALGYSSTPLIDAASEKWAVILAVPKTGNIDRIGFATRTVTTGATVDVRVETVDAATGDPTGTLVGVDTNASQIIADANDNTWFEVTLTSAAAVTKGDIIAIVIVNPAVSPGTMTLAAITTPIHNFPYGDLFTAAWAKAQTLPVVSVRYSDATYPAIPGVLPVSALPSVSLNTGTTPDELGNVFQVPFACRVAGFWSTAISAGATRDFQIILYDSDGTTALATWSQDATIFANTTGGFHEALFASDNVLAINTNYRIVIKPTTASSNTLNGISVNAAALMDMLPGGQVIHRTQRTDAGTWSETTTDRMLIGVLIDQLDNGVALRPQIMRVGGGVMSIY